MLYYLLLHNYNRRPLFQYTSRYCLFSTTNNKNTIYYNGIRGKMELLFYYIIIIIIGIEKNKSKPQQHNKQN